MSANPRSPESGDVPEVIDLDNAADLITRQCFEIAAAGEPHASYAREMQRVAIAGLDLRRRYNALEAENARLTAELSTARARADSAVQDSKRLDELWRLIVMCDVVELFESGAGVQMTGDGDDFGNAPTLRALLDDSIDDWNRTRAILHSVNAPIAPSSLPQSSEATDRAE